MGCSGIDIEEVEKEREERRKELIKKYKIEQFNAAYSSIKKILNDYIFKIYKNNIPPDEKVYLINASSIQRYLSYLKNNNVFDNLRDEKKLKEIEEQLENEFENYDLEVDKAEIYYYYPDCKSLIDNETNHQFIIVDEIFLRNFEIQDYTYKYVNISKINNNNKSNVYELEIYFPIFKSVIIAKEVENEKGIFRFDKIKDQEINPPTENEEDKNKKEYLSKITSICYGLLQIIGNKLQINGKEIKEKTEISKIFLDIAEQYDNNGKIIDCSKLDEKLDKAKYFEIKDIIEFIYNQINNEAIININEIFSFKLVHIFNTPNFNLNPSIHSSEYKYLEIQPNFNNISECIKSYYQKNSSDYYKMEPPKEILTIIVDRGNDNKDYDFIIEDIIDLSYFMDKDNNQSNDKLNFELIEYSCYFSDNSIFTTFFKENNEDIWYYFDGTYIKKQAPEKTVKNPVLFLYKKQ